MAVEFGDTKDNFQLFLQKIPKKLWSVKKNTYLCTRISESAKRSAGNSTEMPL